VSVPAARAAQAGLPRLSRLRTNFVARGILTSRSGRIGAVILLVLLAIALVGPAVSPGSPTQPVGLPFAHPSWSHPLGLDFLGRDGLTRFLHGGRVLLAVSFAATILPYLVGSMVGAAAAFRRGVLDLVTVAVADLVISFPAIVFLLLMIASLSNGLVIVTLGIALIHLPRVVRLVRASSLDIAEREFVEASIARGESGIAILLRDLLPNVLTTIFADFGIRISASVILFASLSYLGLGQSPPASNWALMISENQTGLLVQPWIIVAPALAIALLTVSMNLIADGIARSVGRTLESRDV
jgi:peptide/nickel transport system permease protein